VQDEEVSGTAVLTDEPIGKGEVICLAGI